MAEKHAVHKWQAVLSTTVVIFHTFCKETEKELTPEGCDSNDKIYCSSRSIESITLFALSTWKHA